MLQAELARVRAGVAMEAMDVTRYRLDHPPPERKNDVGAWRRALDNAHSQLEHQYNRRASRRRIWAQFCSIRVQRQRLLCSGLVQTDRR